MLTLATPDEPRCPLVFGDSRQPLSRSAAAIRLNLWGKQVQATRAMLHAKLLTQGTSIRVLSGDADPGWPTTGSAER